MTDLESLVEQALYKTIHTYEDGKSIVMDVSTGTLYFKKILSVYNISVFQFLKDHPNSHIPKIISFREDASGEVLVVIEELIQGKTLEDVLSEENLSFDEKKRILCEICDCLTFLHGAEPPIIHRDLKASNIMLTEDGMVKIIDYDAAKVYVGNEKADTVLIGTHGIAAPEQYGFAQSDARTDIYALGKLIQKMLPESDAALEIAEKATRLEPDKRYSSATQIKRLLEKLKKTAEKDGFRVPGFGSRKKKYRIISWCVLAAVVIAAILAVYAFVWYPEKSVKRPAYDAGIAAMNAGDYDTALSQFAVCGSGYKDVAELIARINELKENEKMTGIIEELMAAAGDEARFSKQLNAFLEEMDYQSFSEEKKKAFRDGIENLFYGNYKNKRNLDTENLIELLAGKYGEKETWEALDAYARMLAFTSVEKYKEAAETIEKLKQSGAVDLEEHIEKIAAVYVADAKTEVRYWRNSSGKVSWLNKAFEIYDAIKTFYEPAKTAAKELETEVSTKAEELFAADEFAAAADHYAILADRGAEDAEDKMKEAYYQSAQMQYKDGDYSAAADTFAKVLDYRDAADMEKQSRYAYGEKMLSEGKYPKAIEIFEQIAGYSDADQKLLESKYEYCAGNADDPDEDTYEYAEELVATGYKGAGKLMTDITTWKADLSWHTGYSIGSMQGVEIEAMLRGGPKSGATHVKFVVSFLNTGEVLTYTTEDAYKSGETASGSIENSNPDFNLLAQTVTISVYDESENLMEEKTGLLKSSED